MENCKTTGQRIKAARKEAKLSQAELACRMGVTNHCISMWERGKRNPKYDTLSRIADAIGVNVNRFLPAANVVERKRGELTYGVITEFENGNVLWYEPITDEINGFVLRTSEGFIVCEWTTNCGADMRGEKHG